MMRGCLGSVVGIVALVVVVLFLADGKWWAIVGGLALVLALAAVVGIVLGVFEGIGRALFGPRR